MNALSEMIVAKAIDTVARRDWLRKTTVAFPLGKPGALASARFGTGIALSIEEASRRITATATPTAQGSTTITPATVFT